jgi:sec-independent protein translocase protein TatB
MELFGVGPLEIRLVVVLALVLFGPKDLAKNARNAGRFLNRLYKSEGWRTMVQASTTLRNLPNRLAREAELDELEQMRRDLAGPIRPPPESIAPAAPAAPAAPPAPDQGMAAWTHAANPPPAPPDPPDSA